MNESLAGDEKKPKGKLVSKVLRPLRKRFAYKVTEIEEVKNLDPMELEELMGSLKGVRD